MQSGRFRGDILDFRQTSYTWFCRNVRYLDCNAIRQDETQATEQVAFVFAELVFGEWWIVDCFGILAALEVAAFFFSCCFFWIASFLSSGTGIANAALSLWQEGSERQYP